MDRFCQLGQIIGLFPIDTSQRLNSKHTSFADGVFGELTFSVRDNLPRNLIKLYLMCENEIY